MTIPLQVVSLYDGKEVFVWSDCLLDLGTDFLVGLFRVCTSHSFSISHRLGRKEAELGCLS